MRKEADGLRPGFVGANQQLSLGFGRRAGPVNLLKVHRLHHYISIRVAGGCGSAFLEEKNPPSNAKLQHNYSAE